jgi:hypothetical protein
VSLPAALVAQVLDAIVDDELPLAVTGPLGIVALAGAAVAGWLVGRRGRHGRCTRLVVGAAVGAAVLALLAGLGLVRQAAAGDDVHATALPALAGAGALLGLVGAALGSRTAARTRP